ncbi:MAG: type II toxin-antitoxin system VapC family toxin [Chthonomonadetes bacterium]|nr:type II toxin-antitoxin system VapC family toxin [Chthonomonadetes bacterium]
MTILLDTHTFLWFVAGDERLPVAARKAIETPENRVLLSVASLWEMAIKISLGRLMLAQPFDIFVRTQLEINNIELLDIKVSHLSELLQLPFHHRDPFDRLLVAQARVEKVMVASRDTVLDAYGVQRIWD